METTIQSHLANVYEKEASTEVRTSIVSDLWAKAEFSRFAISL